MKTNTRFIQSVQKTATQEDVVMPWSRGARRAAFIAKRKSATPERKTA